jgi:hypothetical protein
MTFDWQSFGETMGTLAGVAGLVYQLALAPLRARMQHLEDRLEDIAAALELTPLPRARRRKDGRR